jgi:hypothetical protein
LRTGKKGGLAAWGRARVLLTYLRSASSVTVVSVLRKALVDMSDDLAGLCVLDVLEVPIATAVEDSAQAMPPASETEELVSDLLLHEPLSDRGFAFTVSIERTVM